MDYTPPTGPFEHAKPKITGTDGTYEIESFSHDWYQWKTDVHIDAADFYATHEMGVKMKSRAAIYDHLNMTMSVNESSCQEINQ